MTAAPPPGGAFPMRPRTRHTRLMAARFTVQADTEAECAAELARLCERLGAEPAMPPRQLTDARWMARAVPSTKAPAEDGRGLGVR